MKIFCHDCGERRRQEDQIADGHRDACYDPEAPVEQLCEDCAAVISN